MSFEDGGDLASFAAIAESTIVNKEGKLGRQISFRKLANRVSDHFASLDVRVGEHFVIALRVGHLHEHTIFFTNVYRCLNAVFSANWTKSSVVFRDPGLPLESKSFPGLQKIEALWRSPQTSFYDNYPSPIFLNPIRTPNSCILLVEPIFVSGKFTVVAPRQCWSNFVATGVVEGSFFMFRWCHIYVLISTSFKQFL